MKLKRTFLSFALSFAALSPLAVQAQSADGRSGWPGAGQLFVGTNYQPFDRTREQIPRDIERMKQAGMKVVRMGDLAWDAFEPAEGRFDFKTFDRIMDQMQAAGLKVLLDIPGQPAPIWLQPMGAELLER
jgi:beta-galactosidase